jgi:hypothetical protein
LGGGEGRGGGGGHREEERDVGVVRMKRSKKNDRVTHTAIIMP